MAVEVKTLKFDYEQYANAADFIREYVTGYPMISRIRLHSYIGSEVWEEHEVELLNTLEAIVTELDETNSELAVFM